MGCQSGRMGWFRKPLCPKGYRRFDSSSHRLRFAEDLAKATFAKSTTYLRRVEDRLIGIIFMSLFSKKQSAEPQNIDEVLQQFKEIEGKFQALQTEMEKLKKDNLRNISKVGVTRFNPFEGFGSNQSFCLAMLDGNGCGAVITSLFSRDGNRVYGKPVENGISTYPLSEEEKRAIELAQTQANSKAQSSNNK